MEVIFIDYLQGNTAHCMYQFELGLSDKNF